MACRKVVNETMYSLNTVSDLEKIYKNRGLSSLGVDSSAKTIALDNGKTFHIILDQVISQQVLKSKNFESYNFFQVGFDRLKQKGCPVQEIEWYFSASPVFLEGQGHKVIKQTFNTLLQEEIAKLEGFKDQLNHFFAKRTQTIDSAVSFSTKLVNLVFAKLMVSLLGASFNLCYRLLSQHKNVFYFYFHSLNHQLLEQNLQKIKLSNQSKDENKLLLAYSLITMGHDPLISTLTAHYSDQFPENIKNATKKYCPVSEIERYCINDNELAGIKFQQGDYLSLSLLANTDKKSDINLSFGLGQHACIGKSLTAWVINQAKIIQEKHFPDGFRKKGEIHCEGAFLAFK